MKIVIRVGGSMVIKENGEYNSEFLKKLRKVVDEISREHKVGIVVGGGKFLKKMIQEIRKDFPDIKEEDLHKVGIKMTWVNAELVRSILKNTYRDIITNYSRIPKTRKILVGGGWKPGVTTDYDGVLLAKKMKADLIVKLTDVDGIYNKNPKKYKDARLIKKMSWKKLAFMIKKIEPGMSFPFDPEASKLAMRLGLKLLVINGNKLENLKKFLEGKRFVGTIVE